MFIILLIIIVVLALLLMGTYNKLVRLRNGAEEAFQTINVFLKQRYDLIPNLVSTIKGYTQYEGGVLEKVVALRNTAMAAGGKDGGAADNALSGALKSVFALSENYPDLKANTEFLHLQETLTGLEESIQRSRRYYNASARDLNNAVEVFPSNLIAGPFGFKRMTYFEVDETEKQNVKVQF
ncbi:MAG: LemA family protein [Saprospiraceae bacterium]|uniref:LemA family protein n=1 Tax=Candidatus Opimibacter skivensis TaxID=2982028 RepID=A0A9D7XMQ1_9BACT|nr:LemA family protein [Candidatus Opimibacter skivensis]